MDNGLVQHLANRLECLVTSDGTPIRLVQFSHQSPGLQKLRLQIADAIVNCINEYESPKP